MLRQHNLDDMSFSQISEQARMSISEYFPRWNDLNTHDPGITLIELFAWLTEQQRFYMDQSERAYPFFPLLGITARGASAAVTEVTIEEGYPPRFIPARTPVRAEDVCFETLEDTQYGGERTTINIIQRETMPVPVSLGAAEGYPGASFSADTRGQIVLDFELTVAGERWEMTEDFRLSSPEDRHYTLNRETGDIIFGDGVRGAIPSGEVIITSFSLTRGPDGNIAPDRITQLSGLPVSQPEPALGGTARETVTEALGRFTAEGCRAVTAEDIEGLVSKTPGIEVLRVRAFEAGDKLKPGAARVIKIAVSLRGELTEETRRRIYAQLEPYRLVCRDFHITEPKIVRMSLNLELYAGPHGAGFKKVLEKSVREYFANNYGGFGAAVRVSEVYTFVSAVPETLRVARCAFRVYGGAKISEGGDVLLEPDSLAELTEVTIRIIQSQH